MAYQKVKAERYSNFGGLNTKVSKYQTDQQQVIRLINYDFSTPGALTKRPGFQYFGGASYGGFITELTQYQQRLGGVSYTLVQGQSGWFASGATIFQIRPFWPPGTSLGIGATYGTGITTQSVGSIGSTYVPSVVTANNNVAYYASDSQWISWDARGVTSTVPLPFVYKAEGMVVGAVSYAPGAFFSASYSYRYYLAYQKGTSQVIYSGTPFFPTNGPQTPGIVSARTWSGFFGRDATAAVLQIYPQPEFFGASYYLLYRETHGYTSNQLGLNTVPLSTAIFQIPATYGLGSALPYSYTDYGNPAPGTSFALGASAAILYPRHDYLPFTPNIWPQAVDSELFLEKSQPTIIEIYNNMVFFAGFTTAPSKFYFSNLIDENLGGVDNFGPEYVEPLSFFDLRSNDGDVISCMKAYGTEIVISKRNSIYSATGSAPEAMSQTLKSDQYGIISKRGACTWENYFWFIDRKGIVEYNGANFQVVSTPVEDIFKRMNYEWAQQIAIISHQKMRNEIWCCIPIDGATYNNIVVVYDYVSKGWTTYEGVNASALIATALTMPIPQPVIGSSGGRIAQMGVSNFADFGGVYTTCVRFPFVTNYGWSTDQVFRRLFVDTDPLIGNNRAFQVNMYGNMLNTASYSVATTFGATYQFRIDFGLYGKSISTEIYEASTFALKLNGYTVVSRFQREV